MVDNGRLWSTMVDKGRQTILKDMIIIYIKLCLNLLYHFIIYINYIYNFYQFLYQFKEKILYHFIILIINFNTFSQFSYLFFFFLFSLFFASLAVRAIQASNSFHYHLLIIPYPFISYYLYLSENFKFIKTNNLIFKHIYKFIYHNSLLTIL